MEGDGYLGDSLANHQDLVDVGQSSRHEHAGGVAVAREAVDGKADGTRGDALPDAVRDRLLLLLRQRVRERAARRVREVAALV